MAGKGNTFRERLLRKLVTNPVSMFLFLTGFTDLLVLWTFDIQSGVAAFGGIACLLGAVGFLASKLLLGGKELGRQVVIDMEQEARQLRNQALDELDTKLAADGDPRTEQRLRDLRTFVDLFHKSDSSLTSLDTTASLPIMAGVGELFERCVFALEKTLELWQTAQSIELPEVRQTILAQRERLIGEVEQSIKELGRILTEIKCLQVGSSAEASDLERIRQDLGRSLEVAKRVDQSLKSLQ